MSNWILISERMPTREQANGHIHVWAVDERGRHWIWAYVMMPVSRLARPPIAWHALPRYTPPAPGPTEKECDKIIALLSSESERDDELQGIRDWFADVTARIGSTHRLKGRGRSKRE